MMTQLQATSHQAAAATTSALGLAKSSGPSTAATSHEPPSCRCYDIGVRQLQATSHQAAVATTSALGLAKSSDPSTAATSHEPPSCCCYDIGVRCVEHRQAGQQSTYWAGPLVNSPRREAGLT
ncbi:hypothetical protein RRG08_019870 [Elysia crispata]|uniref:Uncharacterized protein n=1 Tax=Elysia crispata TaxID=231223 RepID=A0AAE1AF25_9GAST|nr:hypothetical protein RRG08_019870 [Elysia crispata]